MKTRGVLFYSLYQLKVSPVKQYHKCNQAVVIGNCKYFPIRSETYPCMDFSALFLIQSKNIIGKHPLKIQINFNKRIH